MEDLSGQDLYKKRPRSVGVSVTESGGTNINDNECQRRVVGVDIVTELDEEKQICIDLAHKGNHGFTWMVMLRITMIRNVACHIQFNKCYI